MRLWTFGHGTAAPEELTALLGAAGIAAVVDVRSAPGSRRNPEMACARLREWLPEHGIGYRWESRLGGFRKVPYDSPDVAWRVDSFRAYAAHMRTTQFRQATDDLLDEAAERTLAVMCSESVWWRCHRRLIADFCVVVRGVAATHLMHDGRHTEHEPMRIGRRVGDEIVYDRVDHADD